MKIFYSIYYWSIIVFCSLKIHKPRQLSDILILTVHITTIRNKKIPRTIKYNKLKFNCIYKKTKFVIYNNNWTTWSWHWLVYPILIYGGGQKWVYSYLSQPNCFHYHNSCLDTLNLLYNYFCPPLYVYE